MDVDARVQHEVDAGGPTSLLHRRQPLGLRLGVDERSLAAVVAVLEVEPDDPAGDHPLDQLAGGQAVTGLEIGRDGHVDCAGDAGHRGEHLGGRCLLAVVVPERPGDPAARGRDRGEAGLGEGHRAGDVPRVGQHQQARAAVQGAQRLGPLGGRSHAVAGSRRTSR